MTLPALSILVLIFACTAVLVGRLAVRFLSRRVADNSNLRRFFLVLTGTITVVSVAAFIAFAFMAAVTAVLPFNSEGRYFDGNTVTDTDVPLQNEIAALAFEIPTVASAIAFVGVLRAGRLTAAP